MLIAVLIAAALAATPNPAAEIEACKGPVTTRLPACLRLLARSDLLPSRRAKTWHNIAQTYWEEGKKRDALEAYDKALSFDGDYVHAYQERSRLRHRLGDRAGALADLDSAVGREKDGVDSRLQRSSMRLELGDAKGAWQDPQAALALSGGSAAALTQEGWLLVRFGRFSDALAPLLSATRADPRNVMAWNDLASAYAGLGKTTERRDALEASIRAKPTSWALIERGMLKEQAGEIAGARSDYDDAIKVDAKEAYAYYNRGRILNLQEDRSGALRDLDQAEKLSDFPALHAFRGQLLFASGRAADAVSEFSWALREYPEYPGILGQRGRAFGVIGRLQEARADCGQALMIDPHDAEAKSCMDALDTLSPQVCNPENQARR